MIVRWPYQATETKYGEKNLVSLIDNILLTAELIKNGEKPNLGIGEFNLFREALKDYLLLDSNHLIVNVYNNSKEIVGAYRIIENYFNLKQQRELKEK